MFKCFFCCFIVRSKLMNKLSSQLFDSESRLFYCFYGPFDYTEYIHTIWSIQMVFPRATLDKTASPPVRTAVIVLLSFFPCWMWESLVELWSSLHWARWQGSASCCCRALVYYCLFFRLLHAWKPAQLQSSLVCEVE